MGERNWRKIWQHVAIVLVIVLALMSAAVGGAVALNVDHLGRLAQVLELIHSQYLEKVSGDQLVDGAIKGMVDSLGDPYSTYMDASDNRQLMDLIYGQFGGVGIVLSLKDPNKLIVLQTIKNTPAAKAGILPGDVIVKIDNVDTSSISQDKAVALMRGDPGTKVTLEVYRESEKKTLTMTMTRENISVPTVEGEPLPGQPDIAYIDISQFSTDTGTELAQVLKSMDIQKYKGVILDLRYNHGGELNAAVKVASYFVTPGPVVYIVDKDGHVTTKNAENTYINKPLVVLVNEETASAAEIVSGAIRDRKTGTLVGVKTFGKGIVQTIFQLDSGTSVKLTTAKYLTPDKISINKKGIEPDVQVKLPKGENATVLPLDTNFDPQLATALRTLQAKINR
ncbi:C-terminal-processing peptidase S41A [Acididesulfobacillus acetoxydans]|uniref:C-terminal-processing peptidase S41A n=1 Tax=Acididesulfobacillus acetoxydans TaxID=1561005 RepID=A0A8S0X320_9FIRM|nr:S41 family peptidase [Acididesulfobacillus acetoxydans]CAA7599700.1 C-terminal-processing peptidase S41A [Acididesulfobacillus acetoxydans]CEJ06252.1 Carboxyl-terminal-processing protease [Acididesulfobacillus acetoxydans]